MEGAFIIIPFMFGSFIIVPFMFGSLKPNIFKNLWVSAVDLDYIGMNGAWVIQYKNLIRKNVPNNKCDGVSRYFFHNWSTLEWIHL